MTLSDEMLMAYADGQLDAGDRARVKKLVAQDPALAARLEVFQATGHGLASVFDEHMNAPLPDSLKRFAERVQPRAAKRPSFGQFADTLRDLLRPAHPFGLAAASAAVLIAGAGFGMAGSWRRRLSIGRACSTRERWHRRPRTSAERAG